jgi:hypothetical protein
VSAQLQNSKPSEWLDRPVTVKGFICSLALPAGWLALFYAFVFHVWFSLGRWPAFGEKLPGWPLQLHHDVVAGFALGLFFSNFLLPQALILTVTFRQWRHFSVYVLSYALALGIAYLGLLASPGPFQNWLFD